MMYVGRTKIFRLCLSVTVGVSLIWLLSQMLVRSEADVIIHYVAPGAACDGKTPCYSDPQDAVDAADKGDEIWVAEGIYTGVEGRRLGGEDSEIVTQTLIISDAVTLRGGYTNDFDTHPDPGIHPTILDAEGLGRVVYLKNAGTAVIHGLHITGGDALMGGGYRGGGVYISGASPMLLHSLVYDNRANEGGGIYLTGTSAKFSHNEIFSNTANVGGGFSLRSSEALLEYNDIYGNEAHSAAGLMLAFSSPTLTGNKIMYNIASQSVGGGLYMIYGSNAILTNNIIADNPSQYGGQVSICNSLPKFLHNTIANSGPGGTGVDLCSGTFGGVAFTNTILSGHAIAISVQEEGLANMDGVLWFDNDTNTGGGGTVNVAHAMVGNPTFVDTSMGNYHLLAASQAINHAVVSAVTTDIDGDIRPFGESADLGADEFVLEPTPTLIPLWLPMVLFH